MRSLLGFLLLGGIATSAHAGRAAVSWPWKGCGLPTTVQRHGPLILAVKKLNQPIDNYQMELVDVDPRTDRLVKEAAEILPRLILRRDQYVCLNGQVHNVGGRLKYVPTEILKFY